MVVFNSKKQLHVSANSGHLQVIKILLKKYHIYAYCEVMLRSHHRYALKSVYLVGSLMVNDSCGFMTDIYLTISLFYTQRG